MTEAPRPDAEFPHPELAAQLSAQATRDRQARIESLLAGDSLRLADFSCSTGGWELDYSRQLLSRDGRDLLLRLAEESGVMDARHGLFDGRPINETEERAVLHTLLRAPQAEAGLEREHEMVQACLSDMADWVERVHSGDHRGFAGDRITDVVNLGIGGPATLAPGTLPLPLCRQCGPRRPGGDPG